MPEPPQADRRRHNQQAEYLIAPENARLLLARSFLSLLLLVRLDARLDHSVSRNGLMRRTAGASRLSIGERKRIKFRHTPFDFPRPRCR